MCRGCIIPQKNTGVNSIYTLYIVTYFKPFSQGIFINLHDIIPVTPISSTSLIFFHKDYTRGVHILHIPGSQFLSTDIRIFDKADLREYCLLQHQA